MSPAERLEALFAKIADRSVSAEDVERELRALMHEVDYDYYREKISSALQWTGIYFSPRKWQRWGSQDRVKDFLLQDIHKARAAAIRANHSGGPDAA